MHLPTLRLFSLLAVAVPSMAGCGHPASEKECETILQRSAELELRSRNITDPAMVESRVAAAREAKHDKLMGLCLGRRVTDAAMECIRQAGSSEDLEACLQ